MPSLICGCVLMLLAVGIGAFGAHALSDVLIANGSQAVFGTANRYHFYHAIALLILGSLELQSAGIQGLRSVATLITLGTLLFSGSLYLLAIFSLGWLGPLTPLGGLLLISGWGALIYRLIKMQ